MEKQGIIYRAENLCSGIVYIGATFKSIDERMKDHIHKSLVGEGGLFQNAIAIDGPNAFRWEQIDTASSPEELAQKEKYYIELFNSKEKGYNQDVGGGFKKTVYQFTIDGWLIGQWPSLSVAALVCWGKTKSVSNACLGYNKSYKDYIWSYSSDITGTINDKRLKRVVQFNLQEKELNTYKSVAEASRKTGLSKSSISRVCRGERQKAGGFIWRYN